MENNAHVSRVLLLPSGSSYSQTSHTATVMTKMGTRTISFEDSKTDRYGPKYIKSHLFGLWCKPYLKGP